MGHSCKEVVASWAVYSTMLHNYMCTSECLVVCNICIFFILIAKDINFRMMNSRAIILCQQILERELSSMTGIEAAAIALP